MIADRDMSQLPSEGLIRHLDSGSDSDARPKVCKRVNQLILTQALGQGSFAKVFLGFDVQLRTFFAVKRFRLKELQRIDSGVSQLEREISAMRKIVHEHIIRLHSVLHDEQSEIVYLVLDYADCGSLDHLIRTTRVNVDLLKYVFVRVLEAVSYLHSQGIIHQDIKPSNILLAGNGGVFLSDFGVGHSFQSAAMVVGSPAYQAPEVLPDSDFDFEWDVNPAGEDIWSLGVTLYQCLFQKLPFVGENVFEIVQDIRSRPLQIPEGTEPELVVLLQGMLTVDPSKRMTIEDVRASPFFLGAPLNVKLPTVKQIEVELGGRFRQIFATVCDEDCSFARPCFAALLLDREKPPPIPTVTHALAVLP
jgi:serine/threonine-protein kinase 11